MTILFGSFGATGHLGLLLLGLIDFKSILLLMGDLDRFDLGPDDYLFRNLSFLRFTV